MASEDPVTTQTLVGWAVTAIGALSTAMGVVFWWMWGKIYEKVESLEDQVGVFVPAEKINQTYATRESVVALDLRISSLASRRELMAYMTQLKEERVAMHNENRADLKNIHEILERKDSHQEEFRREIRNELQKLGMALGRVTTIQEEDRRK